MASKFKVGDKVAYNRGAQPSWFGRTFTITGIRNIREGLPNLVTGRWDDDDTVCRFDEDKLDLVTSEVTDRLATIRDYVIKTAKDKGWPTSEINLHLRNMGLEEFDGMLKQTFVVNAESPLSANDIKRALERQYSMLSVGEVSKV